MKQSTLAERAQTMSETAPLPPNRLTLVPSQAAVQPLWEPSDPTASTPTTDQLRADVRSPDSLPGEIEASIVLALTRPIVPGEGHRDGNDRRERELYELFGQLTPVQTLNVRRRISIARTDDRLAQAFKRLVIDRRQRLTSFLEDPRRRLARKS